MVEAHWPSSECSFLCYNTRERKSENHQVEWIRQNPIVWILREIGETADHHLTSSLRKLRNIDTPTLVSNAYEIYAKFCPDGKIDSLNFGALQKKRITLFDFDHPENLKPYVRMLCARIIRIIERDRHRVRDNWAHMKHQSMMNGWAENRYRWPRPLMHLTKLLQHGHWMRTWEQRLFVKLSE